MDLYSTGVWVKTFTFSEVPLSFPESFAAVGILFADSAK